MSTVVRLALITSGVATASMAGGAAVYRGWWVAAVLVFAGLLQIGIAILVHR